jgi:hypothetical protein
VTNAEFIVERLITIRSLLRIIAGRRIRKVNYLSSQIERFYRRIVPIIFLLTSI